MSRNRLENLADIGASLAIIGAAGCDPAQNSSDIDGSAPASTVSEISPFQQILDILRDPLNPNRHPIGKFLNFSNGEFLVSDKPEVIGITLVSQAAQTVLFPEGKIVVRRSPQQSGPGENDMTMTYSPKEIRARYAIRVFGGTYPTGSQTVGGQIEVKHEGRQHTGGVWYALVDEEGNPINPIGKPVLNGELLYYIAASFINVENPTTQAENPTANSPVANSAK